MNLHAHAFEAIEGGAVRLGDYAGRPVLIVNTASECDTTPQYAGLQRLYERYGDSGLMIVGVPSNDFGQQEPGDDETIRGFCSGRYGITFPLTAKQRVIPPDEHPLYAAIAAELGDLGRPDWNFHKFLFDGDGELAGLWDSRTPPESGEIVEAIAAQLPDA